MARDRVCHAARVGSYGLNAVRVRTSARYHGYIFHIPVAQRMHWVGESGECETRSSR